MVPDGGPKGAWRRRAAAGVAAGILFSHPALSDVVHRDHADRAASDQGHAARSQGPRPPPAPSPTAKDITTDKGTHPANLAGSQQRPTPKNDDGFWNGKFTDWAIVFLTFGLLIVGTVQAKIYFRQANLMRLSLRATAKSNVVARRAGDIAKIAADVATAQLIAASRPKLVVRRLDLPMLAIGQPLAVDGIVANVGGSPATIMDSDFTIHIQDGDKLPATPPMLRKVSPLIKGTVIRPGPGDGFKAQASLVLVEPEFDIIRDPAQIGLVLVGYIAYRDDSGLDRYMSFGRRYDPVRHRFIAVNDENYEYSD